MKRTIILLLSAASLIATSCNKDATTVAPSSAHTCTCTFRKNPLKDSTIIYSASGTPEQAKATCDYKLKTLASQYSNAACNLN